MNTLHALKLCLDNDIPCDDLVEKSIIEFSDIKQHNRGLTTLLLRYYINKQNTDMILHILYNNLNLMNRDYMTCMEYFKNINDENTVQYIYRKINIIETKDINLMIKNNWINLIKKFDGYPIICSYNTNINDFSMLKKYQFDITKMKLKYIERIENKEIIDIQMKDVDLLIDGANMSHLTSVIDYRILSYLIINLQGLGYKPKIILHERHNITDDFLLPYLIRTPMYRNDDDYMIYGMLQYNMMVLSNDMFRDHLKNMDIYTKCFVESMTMRYYNKQFIIPKYSKCIQVIENTIYIPTKNGFYKI
jgi:hypothetical protein